MPWRPVAQQSITNAGPHHLISVASLDTTNKAQLMQIAQHNAQIMRKLKGVTAAQQQMSSPQYFNTYQSSTPSYHGKHQSHKQDYQNFLKFTSTAPKLLHHGNNQHQQQPQFNANNYRVLNSTPNLRDDISLTPPPPPTPAPKQRTTKQHPVINKLQAHLALAQLQHSSKQPKAEPSIRLENIIPPSHYFNKFAQPPPVREYAHGKTQNFAETDGQHLKGPTKNFYGNQYLPPGSNLTAESFVLQNLPGGQNANQKSPYKISFQNQVSDHLGKGEKYLSHETFPSIPPSVLSPFFQQVQQQQGEKGTRIHDDFRGVESEKTVIDDEFTKHLVPPPPRKYPKQENTKPGSEIFSKYVHGYTHQDSNRFAYNVGPFNSQQEATSTESSTFSQYLYPPSTDVPSKFNSFITTNKPGHLKTQTKSPEDILQQHKLLHPSYTGAKRPAEPENEPEQIESNEQQEEIRPQPHFSQQQPQQHHHYHKQQQQQQPQKQAIQSPSQTTFLPTPYVPEENSAITHAFFTIEDAVTLSPQSVGSFNDHHHSVGSNQQPHINYKPSSNYEYHVDYSQQQPKEHYNQQNEHYNQQNEQYNQQNEQYNQQNEQYNQQNEHYNHPNIVTQTQVPKVNVEQQSYQEINFNVRPDHDIHVVSSTEQPNPTTIRHYTTIGPAVTTSFPQTQPPPPPPPPQQPSQPPSPSPSEANQVQQTHERIKIRRRRPKPIQHLVKPEENYAEEVPEETTQAVVHQNHRPRNQQHRGRPLRTRRPLKQQYQQEPQQQQQQQQQQFHQEVQSDHNNKQYHKEVIRRPTTTQETKINHFLPTIQSTEFNDKSVIGLSPTQQALFPETTTDVKHFNKHPVSFYATTHVNPAAVEISNPNQPSPTNGPIDQLITTISSPTTTGFKNFPRVKQQETVHINRRPIPLSTSTTTTTTTEVPVSKKSHRLKASFDIGNRPRFSVKEYRQRLSSTTEANTAVPDTTEPHTRLRFPTRNRFLSDHYNQKQKQNQIVPDEVAEATTIISQTYTDNDVQVQTTTIEPPRKRYPPKERKRFSTLRPAIQSSITTTTTTARPTTSRRRVNTRRDFINRNRNTITPVTASPDPQVPAIRNVSLPLRRPPQLTLRQKIQNKRREEEEKENIEPEVTVDEVKNNVGENESENLNENSGDPFELNTPESVTDGYRHETSIMKIAKDDHSYRPYAHSTTTETTRFNNDDFEDNDLSGAPSDYSQRVAELTISANNNFNSVNTGVLSRRIPGYFTLATDDPILPIEAFFPQLKGENTK